MPSHESFRKEILEFKMIEDDSEELHTDVDPVDFGVRVLEPPGTPLLCFVRHASFWGLLET